MIMDNILEQIKKVINDSIKDKSPLAECDKF